MSLKLKSKTVSKILLKNLKYTITCLLYISLFAVGGDVCRPPLISFDVHREELKDGWLHTTGGTAYETRVIEVDYYDNRRIDDTLFSSQGQVTLINALTPTRRIKYRHRVPIKRGVYIISQDSVDYEVCASDGEVIFYIENIVEVGLPYTQEWTYSVEIDPYGDFNDDGCVNGYDLGMMFAGWGMSGETDINNDGITDGQDLGIFFENWDNDC